MRGVQHRVTCATCQMSAAGSERFKNLEKSWIARGLRSGLRVRGDCGVSLGAVRYFP